MVVMRHVASMPLVPTTASTAMTPMLVPIVAVVVTVAVAECPSARLCSTSTSSLSQQGLRQALG